MRLSDLPPDFVRRLENWGAYFRSERGLPCVSPTYEVCLQMAVEAGETVTDGYREANPRPEVDAEDALVMERHWAMCSYRIPAKDRALVKAHWVDSADPRLVCRVLKIRYLSFEPELAMATQRFRNAVALLESTTYNPRQDNQTTVQGRVESH